MSEEPDPVSAEQPQTSEQPSTEDPSSEDSSSEGLSTEEPSPEKLSVEEGIGENGMVEGRTPTPGDETLTPKYSLGGSARELLNPDGSLRQA